MKSYEDISARIKKTTPVFSGTSRFVILKSNYYPFFEISLKHSVWATTHNTSEKL